MRQIKQYIFLTAILVISAIGDIYSQVAVEVALSRNSVYVQQPFRVTITAYTHTWFTAPLEFGNLQVPNAFIVPFDDTQPGMFTIGGKQYPGVQFYYIVFPYKPGNFTIPSLEITTQSPPEGSSTSQKVVVHTKEQPFIVQDVPKELKKQDYWFVAKGVTIRENWSSDIGKLKVGDVVKRTVTIDAQGTLPQFIPDLSAQEKVDWASLYPQSPELLDTRGNGDANGRSTQVTTYLMEKSGNHTIPEVQVSYWNPYSGKISTIRLDEEKVFIAENPDLGILTTLKDSLNTTIHSEGGNAKVKEPILIFGMAWYEFAGVALAGVTLLYLFIRLGKYVYIRMKRFIKKLVNSENWLFAKLLLFNKNSQKFIVNLYEWWDNLNNKPSASVLTTIGFDYIQEVQSLKKYLMDFYTDKKVVGISAVKELLKKFRIKRVLNDKVVDDNLNDEQELWVFKK